MNHSIIGPEFSLNDIRNVKSFPTLPAFPVPILQLPNIKPINIAEPTSTALITKDDINNTKEKKMIITGDKTASQSNDVKPAVEGSLIIKSYGYLYKILDYISPSEILANDRVTKMIRRYSRNVLYSFILYCVFNEESFFTYFWNQFFLVVRKSFYLLAFLLLVEPFWFLLLPDKHQMINNLKNISFIILSTLLTCSKNILDYIHNFVKDILDC